MIDFEAFSPRIIPNTKPLLRKVWPILMVLLGLAAASLVYDVASRITFTDTFTIFQCYFIVAILLGTLLALSLMYGTYAEWNHLNNRLARKILDVKIHNRGSYGIFGIFIIIWPVVATMTALVFSVHFGMRMYVRLKAE